MPISLLELAVKQPSHDIRKKSAIRVSLLSRVANVRFTHIEAGRYIDL